MNSQDWPQPVVIRRRSGFGPSAPLSVLLLCIVLVCGCARTARPQLIEDRHAGQVSAPAFAGKTVEVLPPIIEYVSLQTEFQLDSRRFGADAVRRVLDSQAREALSGKGARVATGGASKPASPALAALREAIAREIDVMHRRKALGPDGRRWQLQARQESTASLYLVTRLYVKAEGAKIDVPFRSESGQIDLMYGDIDPKLSTSELTGVLIDAATGDVVWLRGIFIRRLVLGTDVDELAELLFSQL